jgi:hypothetical protein
MYGQQSPAIGRNSHQRKVQTVKGALEVKQSSSGIWVPPAQHVPAFVSNANSNGTAKHGNVNRVHVPIAQTAPATNARAATSRTRAFLSLLRVAVGDCCLVTPELVVVVVSAVCDCLLKQEFAISPSTSSPAPTPTTTNSNTATKTHSTEFVNGFATSANTGHDDASNSRAWSPACDAPASVFRW